jgi:adenosylhomocysteinase
MQKPDLKDVSLIAQGERNVALARRNMSALEEIRARFTKEKPFEKLKIGMALHVTKETAVLVETLIAGGAQVAITGCNPLSTQNDVAAFLSNNGVQVYGYKGESEQEYYEFLNKVIEFEADLLIDDGCDLISQLHRDFGHLQSKVIGACEETTTGVQRLRKMHKAGALNFPVIAVNDNKTKHLMDNYYGTGQSTFDGILRATNTLICGKTVVIAGYGSCGKGCALRAKGLGAEVVVTEVDSFAALQARMDGFRVMTMIEAAKIGDLFITVTGNVRVIGKEAFEQMKDGAIACNSGHFDHEIDVEFLRNNADEIQEIRPMMKSYKLSNKEIFVLSDGRLVNLSAAEGHPSEVMSLSFCGQALACEFLVKNRNKLENQVHTLPPEIDDLIAALQLKAMNIEIDTLTEEQKLYLESWQEGT